MDLVEFMKLGFSYLWYLEFQWQDSVAWAQKTTVWLIIFATVLLIPLFGCRMNPRSAIASPTIDPTSIFEHYRGSYGSELLTAAVAHFDIFGRLSKQPASFEQLRADLELQTRAAIVLLTALKAMGLLVDRDGEIHLTELASEHLVPGGDFDVGNYIGLSAESPGVKTMVELLKSNQPLTFDGGGAAFIYRDGIASAMDSTESAKHFTMALAGRAKNVAPRLAEVLDCQSANVLLDVGGGTGIYSYALLQKYPNLRAVILDRPEVLKVAEEVGEEYGVLDRVDFLPGDMFNEHYPAADIVLLSNILHDWDVPECAEIVQRCTESLTSSGRLVIHDVFLNDDLDGPLPIALYSAALFTLTQGRAYSEREYKAWLTDAGLVPSNRIDTLIHCGIVAGVKP